jgi:hypothetical protein
MFRFIAIVLPAVPVAPETPTPLPLSELRVLFLVGGEPCCEVEVEAQLTGSPIYIGLLDILKSRTSKVIELFIPYV